MPACLATLDDLKGDDPAHNAEAIRSVLAGRPGPCATPSSWLPRCPGRGGRAKTLRDAAGLAAQSIDSGAAQAALELVRITNTPAAA